MIEIAYQGYFGRLPQLCGHGFLGGTAPDPAPNSPDGRTKIMNEPARVRVVAYSRVHDTIVGTALSAPDGTWLIEHINPELDLYVIGFDDRGLVNAAIQDWVKPHVPEL